MFLCFYRKDYNKVLLFWLSNILFWKFIGFKDIFIFYLIYFSIIDEYCVKFVYSMVRKFINFLDLIE